VKQLANEIPFQFLYCFCIFFIKIIKINKKKYNDAVIICSSIDDAVIICSSTDDAVIICSSIDDAVIICTSIDDTVIILNLINI
jgi:hypothetical protein